MTKTAEQIYKMFKERGDADHIATLVNIREIINFCQTSKPERILEMGGGVGALSYAMLANSNASLDIYEDNDFCQNKLKENLKEFEGRYAIIPNYRTLPPALHYDFMVIDGGNKESHHPEWFFVRYVESVKAIYIEGYRRSQYAWVSRALFARHTFKTTKVLGEMIDQKFQKGGTFIECTRQYGFIRRAFSYLYGRFTEDELFDRVYKFAKRAIKKA